MLPFIKFCAIVAVVLLAGMLGYGIEFVVLLSAALSVHALWVSRLKPEIMLYLADLPNNLLYWICLGFPISLVLRTLGLSMILVPIYILSP